MNIDLIPAIDIINGQCVRLVRGDYGQSTVYNAKPALQAKQFEQLGFKRLHLVDLDGARGNHIVNHDLLKEITSTTHLQVDFGGGIKTDEDISLAFKSGATMVTVGSVAVSHPERLKAWLKQYGADHIILGADVRNGKISINGWNEDSQTNIIPFLKQWTDLGISKVLCTSISQDGTMEGPDITLYRTIMEKFPRLYLIGSGGISDNNDIIALDKEHIPAVVFGRAWYEGKINIKQLLDEK